MKLSILLFAGVAERIGQASIELNIDHAVTVNDLKMQLAEAYPEASSLIHSSLIAINMDYAPGHVMINDGDEVALIPLFPVVKSPRIQQIPFSKSTARMMDYTLLDMPHYR